MSQEEPSIHNHELRIKLLEADRIREKEDFLEIKERLINIEKLMITQQLEEARSGAFRALVGGGIGGGAIFGVIKAIGALLSAKVL